MSCLAEGTWSLPSVPSAADAARATSAHPLIIGASPGTTGTMSLYFALKMLGISTVHYTRHYNATARAEYTTYGESPPGAPVPLIRPLFGVMPPTGGPPPLDLPAARHADLRFLNATDALIDTPSMELFFELLATFPNARVVLTAREPRAWAASRRRRHPSDAAPLFAQLGFAVPVGAVTEDQARRAPDPPRLRARPHAARRAQAAAAFALWQRVVGGSVPPNRLLILDLFAPRESDAELWQALADFVGAPPPAAGPDGSLPPFPHMRYGEDMRLPP